jgi:CheY-like chemotaxis protein
LDPRFKDVPKIVLSNLSKPSDLDKAKELGATKFLVKADTSLEQILTELRAQCV